jgi:predicted GH43/DUF377 family glycosyl hydrolase
MGHSELQQASGRRDNPGYVRFRRQVFIFTARQIMIPKTAFICGLGALTAVIADGQKGFPPRIEVPAMVMQRIFDESRTPHKYGIVLRGENKKSVDCPRVFRFRGKWYMHYVCMNDVGYETYLAASDDLLQWQPLGKILSFHPGGWDQWQMAGGISLVDPAWEGAFEPQRFRGKYWLSYCGGALKGYETDPLSIGMAWTGDPRRAEEWTRFPGNPVLAPSQADARDFERLTLYKSTVIWDRARSLGEPFVMYYNAKTKNGYERIGMAVSSDMLRWKRYGADPVVSNGEAKTTGISGDPQIVRLGDVWVMHYFGAFWEPNAFDTFAASYDLIHWTKWTAEHLISPSEPWDRQYAHKPWLVKWKGTVYHFYCAVGDQGRVIALATSRDLRKPNSALKLP